MHDARAFAGEELAVVGQRSGDLEVVETFHLLELIAQLRSRISQCIVSSYNVPISELENTAHLEAKTVPAAQSAVRLAARIVSHLPGHICCLPAVRPAVP